MFKVALFASACLLGALLLAGCGTGGDGDASSMASESMPQGNPSFQPVADPAARVKMTPAKIRRVESLALRDRFVKQIADGRQIHVAGKVVPWLSEGGRRLIGGSVKIPVSPPAHLENQRLAAVISPNQQAPPGTPTLYRYVRMSATNVSELEVAVDLHRGRAVRIEPSGAGYKVTKLELIGPPPHSAAYTPEPGY